MKLKKRIKRLLPAAIKRRLRIQYQKKELDLTDKEDCNPHPLRKGDEITLHDIFQDREIEGTWGEAQKKIVSYAIPDGSGGINPGDRKAIYYLICKLNPSSVLEIGTHIGASTLHIASALSVNRIEKGLPANLISVDIADVNDPIRKPWKHFGSKYSPQELMKETGYETFVEFHKGFALDYLKGSDQKFDVIFLDGDHGAKAVYQEIPAALRILNDNGVILLHDYYPNMEPLWSDGLVIPGPFLSIKRLQDEGSKLVPLPLDTLPWPTKLNSNVSSLALLLAQKET